MIRIGICDDSPAFLQQTKFMVDHWQECPQKIISYIFESPDALICAHAENPFDIILLDILMPLQNGIEVAAELRESDSAVKIVFLTSSSEFAVDSYTVHASNYLLKPVVPSRLFACLEELIVDIQSQSSHIFVKSADSLHRIELNDIEYIEAQNKRILFSLTSGKAIITTDPLYTFENKLTLSDGFFKCHRSYIINLNKIDTYTQKEIEMHSGYRIPISRSCRKEFETAYFSTIFGKAGENK